MINKLILFSINTGLLTSICAVMSLISVRTKLRLVWCGASDLAQITVWDGTFIYIAFYFCLGRRKCRSTAPYNLRD
jgi:hypothetical protein